MPARDPNRRVYASLPLRGVGSGEQQHHKEALEGHSASPVPTVRHQRALDASLAPKGKSFAERLERTAPPPKK